MSLTESPNVGPRRGYDRPDILLLHYTGVETTAKAIDFLTRPGGVSCHYVVDEAGVITQLVPEALRAWHAGEAYWAGETDINSASIGIEIQNPGHEWGYPDFPRVQIEAVEALCLDIIARNRIRPERVLGHSDVAPMRKKDPGEKFPWARLAHTRIGHWMEPAPVNEAEPGLGPGAAAPLVAEVQLSLLRYGYGIEATGVIDTKTELVVTAFQRHFRPGRVDGRIDPSTVDTLERLLTALPPRAP
jgi:N-acetylmuramoyl-L-alanine amidase